MSNGGTREVAADHGGALQDGAFLRTQPLDAGGEQRVDGRRHIESGEINRSRPAITLALEGTVVDQHAHQLTEEQRVALAGGEHASGNGSRQLTGADNVRSQTRRRAGVETGECDNLCHEAPDSRQRRARVAQLGAGGGQYQQRDLFAPLDQVLDQIEQQRLRPLQIVDAEHHRSRSSERGEEAPHHEEGLLRRRRRAGEEGGDPVGDAGMLVIIAGERGVNCCSQGISGAVRSRRLGEKSLRRHQIAFTLTLRQTRGILLSNPGQGALVVDPQECTHRLGERCEGGAASWLTMRPQHGGAVVRSASDFVEQP